MSYLHNVKKTSRNTELSYQRDLMKMMHFLQKQKVEEANEVTETALNSYILDLEKNGMSAATVSRNIASMKGFYLYLWKEGSISSDPAEKLKAPKVEKKLPEIMSVEEMERLLEQPGDRTAKGLRDSAMLELLYATGIRVTELISLKPVSYTHLMCIRDSWYSDLPGLRSPTAGPVCTGCGLDLPQNIGNVGEPGVEEMQSIQRRQGTAAFLSVGLVAGIFPVFLGFPARKLCKSPVFEGGFEKYLKLFDVIFTRFGGMAGKENQILWRKRKNP